MTLCKSPLYWHNCYNQSFDLWCSDAMSHPAKMSPALAFRIMEHLKELVLLAEGEPILDPMCGIATTGLVAGALGHHPEIYLSYGLVKIKLTTHDAGGLTKKDFELAEEIETSGYKNVISKS